MRDDAKKSGERNWRNAAKDRERQLAEASKEGLGSKRAVVPMMMMMMMMLITWRRKLMKYASKYAIRVCTVIIDKLGGGLW